MSRSLSRARDTALQRAVDPRRGSYHSLSLSHKENPINVRLSDFKGKTLAAIDILQERFAPRSLHFFHSARRSHASREKITASRYVTKLQVSVGCLCLFNARDDGGRPLLGINIHGKADCLDYISRSIR